MLSTNGDANCIELSSEPELSALAKAILDPQRDYPIVCLTTRVGEPHPALPAAAVREVTGPGIPIYLISTGPLTRYLSKLLPPRLDLWGGAARVWWPGASAHSDPLAHPLIYDPSGLYGKDSFEKLAAEFTLPTRPDLTIKQQLVLAERQRSQLAERAAHLEGALANTRRERDAALRENGNVNPEVEGERNAEGAAEEAVDEAEAPARERDAKDEGGTPAEVEVPAGERDAEDEAAVPVRNRSDVEGELYKLIWSGWVDICPPDERAERPPRRFTLSRELIRTITQRRVDVPLERLAWVCAMVISDRAIGHASIDAHLYRGSEESMRSDGAKAMRAALKRSPGGPRLHYWSLPNGTIEFTQIGYHDMSLT